MWEYDGSYYENSETEVHTNLVYDFATALYQSKAVELKNTPHNHMVMHVWVPDEEWVIEFVKNNPNGYNGYEDDDHYDLPKLSV